MSRIQWSFVRLFLFLTCMSFALVACGDQPCNNINVIPNGALNDSTAIRGGVPSSPSCDSNLIIEPSNFFEDELTDQEKEDFKNFFENP